MQRPRENPPSPPFYKGGKEPSSPFSKGGPRGISSQLDKLIDDYLRLLSRATGAFASFKDAAPGAIVCKPGCCDCCIGLFEITSLDAEILSLASPQLPPAELARVRREAASQLGHLHEIEPRLPSGGVGTPSSSPGSDRRVKVRGVLSCAGATTPSSGADSQVTFTERGLTSLVSQVGNVRCPLLDEANQCALYSFRPLACRLQGLPRVSRPCGVAVEMPRHKGRAGALARLTLDVDEIFDLETEMLARYAKIAGSPDAAHAFCFVATAVAQA